jgi:hypothetical protein
MNDTERKAAEAERLAGEITPYCLQVENDAYEALLNETDPERVMEHKHFINASRKFRDALRTAIVLGKQSARKAPAVA